MQKNSGILRRHSRNDWDALGRIVETGEKVCVDSDIVQGGSNIVRAHVGNDTYHSVRRVSTEDRGSAHVQSGMVHAQIHMVHAHTMIDPYVSRMATEKKIRTDIVQNAYVDNDIVQKAYVDGALVQKSCADDSDIVHANNENVYEMRKLAEDLEANLDIHGLLACIKMVSCVCACVYV